MTKIYSFYLGNPRRIKTGINWTRPDSAQGLLIASNKNHKSLCRLDPSTITVPSSPLFILDRGHPGGPWYVSDRLTREVLGGDKEVSDCQRETVGE